MAQTAPQSLINTATQLIQPNFEYFPDSSFHACGPCADSFKKIPLTIILTMWGQDGQFKLRNESSKPVPCGYGLGQKKASSLIHESTLVDCGDMINLWDLPLYYVMKIIYVFSRSFLLTWYGASCQLIMTTGKVLWQGHLSSKPGRNHQGLEVGWRHISLPCSDEFQSLLACARFKLATHRDETLSILLLMPGVICSLEDWLPRWKQGNGWSLWDGLSRIKGTKGKCPDREMWGHGEGAI